MDSILDLTEMVFNFLHVLMPRYFGGEAVLFATFQWFGVKKKLYSERERKYCEMLAFNLVQGILFKSSVGL